MENIQNEIIGIAGMKGFGKSTFMKQTFSSEPAVALIDTLGEHADWFPRCPEPSIPGQVLYLASPPEQFQTSFILNPFGGGNAHFNALMKAAYLAGDMTLIIEEMDNYSRANSEEPGTKLIINYGRHRLVNLVWITRNLPAVSRLVTSQTDIFILFRQQEPIYLESMADRFTPEIVEQVAILPQFEYLAVDRDKNWQRYRLDGTEVAHESDANFSADATEEGASHNNEEQYDEEQNYQQENGDEDATE